jgi:integrase
MAHVRTLQRADGSTAHEVRWRQAGKFKQRTFRVKREAERFALRIEDEVEQGNSTDIYVKRSKTVADVVNASLAASKPKLKPRTYISYQQNYDNHIIPALGARRVVSVTSQDVEAFVQSLTAKGLSPASVRNNFVALNKAFKYAVRHSLVTRNPCTGTPLPTATTDEQFVAQILTPEQVEALATHLDEHAPYGLIVRMASYTGLRAGEMAALRIRDVNLLRKHIEVRQNVQRANGERVIGNPKSKRSNREVPILSSRLLVDLTAYLADHPRRHESDAPLWPGSTRGRYPELAYTRAFAFSTFYQHHYKTALSSLGMPSVRFHDLRHTAASLWLAAGIPPYKVSRWLGHANVTTTDGIYGHLYPGDHSAETALLDAYVDTATTARELG